MSLLRRRVMDDGKIDWQINVTEVNWAGNRGYPHKKVGDTYIINPSGSYMPVDSCKGENRSASIEFEIRVTPAISCPVTIWYEGVTNYAIILTSGYPTGNSSDTLQNEGEEYAWHGNWNDGVHDSICCNFTNWNGNLPGGSSNACANDASLYVELHSKYYHLMSTDVTKDAYVHFIIDGTDASVHIPMCKKDWYLAIQEFRHYLAYDSSFHDGTSGSTHNRDYWLQNSMRDINDTSLYGVQTTIPLSSYSTAKGIPEFLVTPVMESSTIKEYDFIHSAPILVKKLNFETPTSLGKLTYPMSYRSSESDASLYHAMYNNSVFAFKIITNCCKIDVNYSGGGGENFQRFSMGHNHSNSGTGNGCFYVKGKETPDASTYPTFGNGTDLNTSILVDDLENKCEVTFWVVAKYHNWDATQSSIPKITFDIQGYKGPGTGASSGRCYYMFRGIELWPRVIYKIENRWLIPRTSLNTYTSTIFGGSSSSAMQYYDLTYNNASGTSGGTSNPNLMEILAKDDTNRYYIGRLYSSGSAEPRIGSSGLYYEIHGSDLTDITDGMSYHGANYMIKNPSDVGTYSTFGLITFLGIVYNGYNSQSSSKYFRWTNWGLDNGGNNSKHTSDSSMYATNIQALNGSTTIGTYWTNVTVSGSFVGAANKRAIGTSYSNSISHYLRPQSFVLRTTWTYPPA